MSGLTRRGPVGVLAMTYGGPDKIEAVPGYLADIRAGRPTPRRVLEEITEHYRCIGGSSPLLKNTQRQIAALALRLGPGFRCYVGMRHWSPWIEETVGAMAEDGITQAVGIVLAPHFNGWNNGRYFQKIEAGRAMYRAPIEFAMVKSYHDAPGLIAALAYRVQEGLAQWSAERCGEVHVVFCAHSLPVRVAPEGDPYASQLLETARRVAAKAELAADRWSWAYVSAGRSAEPWLGPSLLDHLQGLVARGIRDVVCVPVGFVTDHVEVLYDIDVEARQRAVQLGMRLVRPASLNDDPLFIETLAEAVKQRATVLAGKNAPA